MSTLADEFKDVIEFATMHPEWGDGFAHALEGVVDYLRLNRDDDVERAEMILGNLLAVFKEHVT